MTFEEFKGTCYHTCSLLRVPSLNMSIDKTRLLMTKGKYDFKKEDKLLRKLYEEHEDKLKTI